MIFHWKAGGQRNWGGASSKHLHFLSSKTQTEHEKSRLDGDRVAELGSLSSGAKRAKKVFVKRIFTIFATNASFLHVITNLQI